MDGGLGIWHYTNAQSAELSTETGGYVVGQFRWSDQICPNKDENFDLLIDHHTGTGNHARAINSLDGEGNASFQLPFTTRELENALGLIGGAKYSLSTLSSFRHKLHHLSPIPSHFLHRFAAYWTCTQPTGNQKAAK